MSPASFTVTELLKITTALNELNSASGIEFQVSCHKARLFAQFTAVEGPAFVVTGKIDDTVGLPQKFEAQLPHYWEFESLCLKEVGKAIKEMAANHSAMLKTVA